MKHFIFLFISILLFSCIAPPVAQEKNNQSVFTHSWDAPSNSPSQPEVYEAPISPNPISYSPPIYTPAPSPIIEETPIIEEPISEYGANEIDYQTRVTNHNTNYHQNFSCYSSACSKTIAPTIGSNITISNSGNNLKPGDRVCIKAGAYGWLRITQVQGSKSSPIEIVNCDGQVHLTYYKNPIVITGSSRYLKFRGDGHKNTKYGFYIDRVTSEQGIAISGKSRDFEISWIHIYNIQGFAGLMAKSDLKYTSDPIDSETGKRFVQTNTHIHHVKVEKTTEGEGFYIGYNNCGPTSEEFRLRGVNIHDNIITETGAEGMQVGCADTDTKIHHNYLSDMGWTPFSTSGQDGGLQLGGGTTAKVYENWIENVSGRCVHLSGGQADPNSNTQVHFYKNTVKDCGSLFYLNVALDNAPVGKKNIRIERNDFETYRGDYIHAHHFIKNFPIEFIDNSFTGNRTTQDFIRYNTDTLYKSFSTMTQVIFSGNIFN